MHKILSNSRGGAQASNLGQTVRGTTGVTFGSNGKGRPHDIKFGPNSKGGPQHQILVQM